MPKRFRWSLFTGGTFLFCGSSTPHAQGIASGLLGHSNTGVRVPVPNPEWRFPIRLVTSGVIAKLWESKGQERGNAIAASVLPVLALHVSPSSATNPWTGQYRLSYLDIAQMSGVGHGSVRNAMDRLKSAKLLKKWTRARVGGELGFRIPKGRRRIIFYRLKAKVLYPQIGEGWVKLPASLFQSGTWADLPPAGRPLYLVLLGLEDYPVTLSELGEVSGLPKRTLLRALEALRETTVDGKPLVEGYKANTVGSPG
jgi:hypothetical protein